MNNSIKTNFPSCNLKTCRYYKGGNCVNKNKYAICDYARLYSKAKKGLLLNLPVSIGQTVYIPTCDYYNRETECEESVVLKMVVVEIKTGFRRDNGELFIGFFTENEKGESLWFYPEQIGERYFLLEEEAKQKLDEMMGKA